MGGVTGAALALTYNAGMPTGLLFMAPNAPFFLLARNRIGWPFKL